jgi:sugar-specific transcriptional regulator TrmB
LSPVEKVAEILSDFGLTHNQAKVYIATAQLGLASVGQISKLSKVRREDVYRVLPKLEKRGLIEKLLGTPTKIRATPIKEAIAILIKREEEKASERVTQLKVKTKEFLRKFDTNSLKPAIATEEANFALISQRDGILTKTLNIIENSKKELDLTCSTTKLMQFIHTFSDQLRKAIKKGVKIRIIAEAPESGSSLPRILEEQLAPGNSADLKYTNLTTAHYLLSDFAQAFVATTIEGNMADNPCLWTDNKSLVSLLQGNFENLWQSSLDWKNIPTDAVPEKLTAILEQLKTSNHVILVYDSPEAKRDVLFSYLKMGLENGEAGIYVASDETPSEIRKAIRQFDRKMKKYEETGALRILGYEDVYIINGKFNPKTTINLWKKLQEESKAKGFPVMRVTGEMACFLKHNLTEELLNYERQLHRTLELPIIAICAYDAKMLNKKRDPINLYTELVRMHSKILFTDMENKIRKIEIRNT